MSIRDWIKPRLQDLVMRQMNELRPETVEPARGEVLEVGFGTALNLALYGPEVQSVTGVDPMEIEHVDIEIEYEGEGVLQWNLNDGHFHSFEVSGDFIMIVDQGLLIEAMGQEMSIEQILEFSGSLTYEVSAE